MKLLFAVADGGGNLPPQLAVARALRTRGVDVHFTGHHGVRDRVEGLGFPFIPLARCHPFDPTVRRSTFATMAEFTKVTLDRAFGDSAVQVAQHLGVDAVVIDMIATAGIRTVLGTGLPTIVFVHCFYRAVQDMAGGPLGLILRAKGVNPFGAEREALHIVSARADLDPTKGTPPVHHVGAVWQGRPTAAVARPTPHILVSLSTCSYAGQRRMLQHIMDAIAPLPVEATVTIGPAIDADGLRVPPNATTHAWLDHDTVLPHTSLVIGHGGHSTAMRALSFGIPVLVLPANPMIDQRGVGAALQRAGAGRLLPKSAGPKRIRAAVQEILGDPGYRRAANQLGEDIRAHDGAEIAADAILTYVQDRGPSSSSGAGGPP